MRFRRICQIRVLSSHFSKLIEQTLRGEEVIIAKNGVPIIQLTPYEKRSTSRKGGQLSGMVFMSDDFDDPLPKEYFF